MKWLMPVILGLWLGQLGHAADVPAEYQVVNCFSPQIQDGGYLLNVKTEGTRYVAELSQVGYVGATAPESVPVKFDGILVKGTCELSLTQENSVPGHGLRLTLRGSGHGAPMSGRLAGRAASELTCFVAREILDKFCLQESGN